MGLFENLALVFVAGFITALATGLGAIPFFFVEEFNDRWNVALWGVASGIMVSASVFGLIGEGLANGTIEQITPGLIAGVLLVIVAGRIIERVDVSDQAEAHMAEQERAAAAERSANPDSTPEHDDHSHDHEHEHDDHGHGHDHGFQPQDLVEANFRKLILILSILTVHSFPEGVAIGVSFADLNLAGGLALYGFAVPVLAIFMTVAISIHNIPEGVAISIPLQSLGMSRWRMVGAAIFSSLPQPIG
ncbi:MAG: ZIP family metal transporter, partial [Halobacteriales archaeon]|nr:ZIP family metal transporter [Halobacteriales archaeon]